MEAVKPKDLERVIVDTTVQEKAIAHPVDSRLLEIARHKVVSAAKRADIQLKQTFAKEGKALRWRAGGYAHAKQFRRLKGVLKRQRTILGVVMREVQRKMQGVGFAPDQPKAVSDLSMWLERAERIRSLQRTTSSSSLRLKLCLRYSRLAIRRIASLGRPALERPAPITVSVVSNMSWALRISPARL
jgi:hypothetical protein